LTPFSEFLTVVVLPRVNLKHHQRRQQHLVRSCSQSSAFKLAPPADVVMEAIIANWLGEFIAVVRTAPRRRAAINSGAQESSRSIVL